MSVLITWSLNSRSSHCALWNQPAFLLVVKVDCILLTKRWKLLCWPTTSRVNCRLLAPAAAGFVFQTRWRTSAHCSSRKTGSVSIVLVSLTKINGSRTLWALNYHVWVPCWRNLRPKPQTITDLKMALKTIWDDLPLEPINEAIKSFTQRLKTCVRSSRCRTHWTPIVINTLRSLYDSKFVRFD